MLTLPLNSNPTYHRSGDKHRQWNGDIHQHSQPVCGRAFYNYIVENVSVVQLAHVGAGTKVREACV